MNRGEGRGPCPVAATSFQGIVEGAMREVEVPPIPADVREAFRRFALSIEADLKKFDASFLARLANAEWNEAIALLKQHCIDRFDRCAEWLSPLAVSSDPLVVNPVYEHSLDLLAQQTLEFLSETLQSARSDLKEEVRSWVALKLKSRTLEFVGQASVEHLGQHAPPTIDLAALSAWQRTASGTDDATVAKEEPAGLSTAPAAEQKRQAVKASLDDLFIFRQTSGGLWEVAYGSERRVGLKHVEGMKLIRALLAAPGQPFSAAEFVVDGVAVVDEERQADNWTDEDGHTGDGLAIAGRTSQWRGVPTLDDQAMRETRAEVRRLREAQREAEERCDADESDRLAEEIEALEERLKADLGLHGPRVIDSDHERARKAATRRYRTALRIVKESLPDLADHLQRCIRPGATFVYSPDGPIMWMT